MYIEKLVIKNFKKFCGQHVFEFDKDINILVGDNETGKSTILEALEIVLNSRLHNRPLSQKLSTNLFNSKAIKNFIAGDKSSASLPEILIEVYFSDVENLTNESKMKGSNNSQKEDTTGVFIKISFDEKLKDSYTAFLQTTPDLNILPIEFYKTEWFDFAWKPIQYYDSSFRCAFIDPSKIHPTYGRNQYIRNMLGFIGDDNLNTLNLSFRQLKAKFDENADVVKINASLDTTNEITEKQLSIVADIASTNAWEKNLHLAINGVHFDHVGKGEQTQTQIMLALRNKIEDVPFVLIEEPENHLSHMNLVKLIKRIEDKNLGKQLFLTTHSSYVLNKLSVDKVCVISKDGYNRLTDVDKGTIKRLRRLPGYDTLRVVLADKVVLVEGPSDEIVLKKIYLLKHGVLPEENGIDIIVVRGIGFKNYLNVAKSIEKPVRVVKDNDGDYQKKIINWSAEYSSDSFFNFFSSTCKKCTSLEPALIYANSSDEAQLNKYAKVVLSTQTYNKYVTESGLDAKQTFLKKWFKDSGAKKVDSAIRILDSGAEIIFPDYLVEAIKFDS